MYIASRAELDRTRRLLGSEVAELVPDPAMLREAEEKKNAQLFTPLVLVTGMVGLFLTIILTEPLPLALIPLALALRKLAIHKNTFRRAEHFEHDYPALLLSLASGIRTGIDPLQALSQSADLFEQDTIMHRELLELKDALDRGASEEQAICRFGASIGHPDLKLFRTAFILSRREGASLGECLQRLTRVTRLRQSFRRKIRSAVAMQKMSSLGIGGCALAIGAIQAATNPDALLLAINDPIGVKALSVGVLLMLGGLGWMLFLTRARL